MGQISLFFLTSKFIKATFYFELLKINGTFSSFLNRILLKKLVKEHK